MFVVIVNMRLSLCWSFAGVVPSLIVVISVTHHHDLVSNQCDYTKIELVSGMLVSGMH